jgi:hypothetical protein
MQHYAAFLRWWHNTFATDTLKIRVRITEQGRNVEEHELKHLKISCSRKYMNQ